MTWGQTFLSGRRIARQERLAHMPLERKRKTELTQNQASVYAEGTSEGFHELPHSTFA